MIDKIICGFDDFFLGSTLFQHGNKLGNKEPETDGCTLGINNRQIKVRVVSSTLFLAMFAALKVPAIPVEKHR